MMEVSQVPRKTSIHIVLMLVLAMSSTFVIAPGTEAAGFDTQIFRAAAIGVAVNAASNPLNKFINTLTLNSRVPVGMSTKVVPILSVGEKGYVGAAQVAGPQSYVQSVKVVWVYEDNFSRNEFRIKVLVPSSSLNPLELRRVPKVGVSAIIDVALDGRWKGQTYSRSLKAGDVLKAGVVAVAVNAAADPLNRAINTITINSGASTKVVPIITVGSKAYIGGVQVSGSSSSVRAVKAVYQYEGVFDSGRYRVKALVPADSTNPLRIRRVAGVGITALIDTSIARQEDIRSREWRSWRGNYRPIGVVLDDRFRDDIERHDNGKHLGWYIGKGNQRKQLTGVWAERYEKLDPRDRPAFESWYLRYGSLKPSELDRKWDEWTKERSKAHTVSKGSEERERESKRESNRGNGKGKH